MTGAIVEVVIVGAGGFAEEVIEYLRAMPMAMLVGITDDFLRSEPPAEVRGIPFLSSLEFAMSEHPDAEFVVAAGTPAFREETCERLLMAGRRLFTVIHPSAFIASDARIEPGCIVAPFAVVNAGARLGTGSVLNLFCIVAHGARVGAYSVLSPFAAVNGWGEIGRACFLGTRATVYPRVRVGDRCVIDTHSYAKADVEDRMIVTVRGDYRVLKNRLEKR